MTLLLDTHVWIWAHESPEQLGRHARVALEDSGNRLVVSAISTLEISRLVSAGRLELKGTLKHWVGKSLDYLGIVALPMTHEVARRAYELKEPFHRDPADRIVVSTALCEKCKLITADERILAYSHVRTQDARR